MNVSSLIIFIILCSFSISATAQEAADYFLLVKNNPEYVYFINGKLYGTPVSSEDIDFFITSKSSYRDYLKAKNQKNINGEPPVMPGISFKTKNYSSLTECEFEEISMRDFKWLMQNEMIKTQDNIELNNFENIHLILEVKGKHFLYNVLREFTSH